MNHIVTYKLKQLTLNWTAQETEQISGLCSLYEETRFVLFYGDNNYIPHCLNSKMQLSKNPYLIDHLFDLSHAIIYHLYFNNHL